MRILFAKMKQSLLSFGRKIVQLGLIVVLATYFLPLKKKNIITYRTAKAICIRECLNVNFPCSQKGRWFYNAGDNLFLSKWVLFCRFFAFKNHNSKIELIMS